MSEETKKENKFDTAKLNRTWKEISAEAASKPEAVIISKASQSNDYKFPSSISKVVGASCIAISSITGVFVGVALLAVSGVIV